MSKEKYTLALEINDDGAVKVVRRLKDETDDAANSVVGLKQQLKFMQQELQKLDVGSAEFQKLAAEAGKLKDQINDAAEAVRANAGNSFESLSNNASVLKDRLFNLDLEGVGQSFKSIAGTVKGFSFKEMQAGLSSLGSGLGAIGKALLTNPIFLIAGAIAAAVAYSEELLSLVDGISDADQEQLEAQKEKSKLAQENLDSISAQEEILKEQGLTEKEITKLKQQQLDQAITEQEVVIQTQKTQLVAQVEAAKRNKEFLVGILNFLTAPVRFLLDTVNTILDGANAIGIISDETRKSIGDVTSYLDQANDAVAGLLFDPEQVKKDGEAALKESENQLIKLQNQAAGYRNKEREAAKKANEQKTKDRVEEEMSMAEAVLLVNADLEEEIVKNNEELQARLAAINQKAFELSKAAQLAQAEEIEAIQKEIELKQEERGKTARELELEALRANYFEKKTLLEFAGQETTALTELYESEQAAIKEKYAQEDMERERRVTDAKIGYAAQGLNALGGLLDAFSNKSKKNTRKNFQREKAFAIATATMNTYLAASAALALKPSESLFPGQRFVEMGLAIAAGIAQVTKIARSKFDEGSTSESASSGGGGGGGLAGMVMNAAGGGNQPPVPAFNALNLGFLQNRPDQTPKAYVLAQDVSTAVEARDKVRDLARIN